LRRRAAQESQFVLDIGRGYWHTDRVNPAPPYTPVERLAFFVRHLLGIIGNHYHGGPLGGRIPAPLISLIFERLKHLRDRFARLAPQIVAGTYRPRRTAPRQNAIAAHPHPESPFRKRGWLDDLLPEAVAAPLRGHVLGLFEDPGMQALIAAAPAPMARIFRPLCYAMRLKPPPILASPRRPAGTPEPAPKPYVAPPPPPPPIPAPANTLGLHPIQLAPLHQAPPKPA
jgi:hypothetical protein